MHWNYIILILIRNFSSDADIVEIAACYSFNFLFLQDFSLNMISYTHEKKSGNTYSTKVSKVSSLSGKQAVLSHHEFIQVVAS